MFTVHPRDRAVLEFLNVDQYKCWIAGGAARAWYENRHVDAGSDIDIFFHKREGFDTMRDFLNQQCNVSLGKSFDDLLSSFSILKPKPKNDERYYVTQLFSSDNAITYRVEGSKNLIDYRIQLICKYFYESPEKVIENFDISVCQVATDGNSFWTGEHFVQDLKTRTLRFVNHQPDMIKRLLKYWVYGFEPDMETLEYIQNNQKLIIDFNGGAEDYNAF